MISDIALSGEIDVRSCLSADYTVIRNNFVEYSVKAPTTDAIVLKLALCSSNNAGRKRKLLVGRDRFCSTIRSSKAQIQSLHRQISLHAVELKSMQFEANRLEASFQAGKHQLYTSSVDFISADAKRDQNRT